MIRRSQRECTKNQSLTSTNSLNSSANGGLPAPKSSRGSTSSSSCTTMLKPTQQPAGLSSSCSSSSSSSSAAAAADQSESTRTGSGRHPHPPNASNTKLKHRCPFEGCPWRFATPYKLRRHIKSHTKETPYLCKECGRGFSVRYNLLMHIQTIHSQPQKYKCPLRGCKEAFHSQSRLNGHLRRIHKKDWKSLQNCRDVDLKSTDRVRSEDSADGATPTDGPGRKTSISSAPYKCPHCQDEFTSKAKLAAHVKVHTIEKPFKCTIQGCEKCFTSEEKLSKHTEMHKNSKQFCCPHKNCNRIFLRQTHLRNHLKIHTQDHQFICPVLDCSQKFSSEGAYNVHLNTHINYGYSCPFPGCEQSFLSRKRLAIHTQVVHNMLSTETGITMLDGIQPHLGLSTMMGPLHSPTSPSYMALPPHHAPLHISKSFVLDKEFIRNIDLPGLSVDDIEAVLSENEDWSGEQIDQFLRSAVDLSEIESKLFSLTGYESDSGYSTYDVSPITSNTPVNYSVGGQVSALSSCPPPPLTLITSPLFGSPSFPGMPPLPHHPSRSPLMHDTAVSPCGSDGGFFSPHSSFSSLANTPSHESMVFFPNPPPPVPMYSQPFTQAQEFNGNMFSNNCFSDISNSSFGLQIPDIILHDVRMPNLPPIVPTSADRKFPCCSREGFVKTEGSKGVPSVLKSETCSKGSCAFEGEKTPDSSSLTPSPAQGSEVGEKQESSLVGTSCAQSSESNKRQRIPTTAATQYRYSTTDLAGSLSKKGKSGTTKMCKAGAKASLKKKKTQWPRSMNRANLMAFREHILNKLKKAQEVPAEPSNTAPTHATPVASLVMESTGTAGDGSPTPIKFEAPSPNAEFELQVTYERNHLSPPKRCHSEPARLQNKMGVDLPLQNSQSDSNINGTSSHFPSELRLLATSAGDCGGMFSEFFCNPDTFLSPGVDDKFMDDLDLKFSMEAGEESEIFNLYSGSEHPLDCPSSSSISDVETMDIDLQELLDDSKQQVFSPSSSPSLPGSPNLAECDSETLSSSPASFSPSNSVSPIANGSVIQHSFCDDNSSSSPGEEDGNAFQFPEILSIHGSMVLDGVSVMSDGETDYQTQPAFLQFH